MRIGVILAAVTGLALAAYLVVYVGFGPVLAAIAAVGWDGFALLCLYGAALFALLGAAWFVLIPARYRPNIATFIWGRAVRDCAGEVLPFSQVGGMVIGARAAMLRGTGGPLAFASTVVDITVEMVGEIAFVLAGLAILVTRVPPSAASGQLARGIAIGLFAAALGAAVFVVLQRKSLSTIVRWMSRLLPEAAGRAGAIQHIFAEIYESPLRLGLSLAIHLTGWLATALWAWLAVRLIGQPLSFSSIVAIEAILYGIRSAAIFVPAAIGVQEAAYALLGPLFGLAAPAALALSLLKRARDITLSIPILLAWQLAEGGHALKASSDAARLVVDE
ncbi:MAG TPA: lysylphosphatidylglycerol synthase domain-containing protein [Rhizomicrobium sp.]|jgi:putative membrane protein|nr:lysylphosphatidylglycerol synthase domain-containing protein [Rhizomicrobium sp.]